MHKKQKQSNKTEAPLISSSSSFSSSLSLGCTWKRRINGKRMACKSQSTSRTAPQRTAKSEARAWWAQSIWGHWWACNKSKLLDHYHHQQKSVEEEKTEQIFVLVFRFFIFDVVFFLPFYVCVHFVLIFRSQLRTNLDSGLSKKEYKDGFNARVKWWAKKKKEEEGIEER